MCAECNNKLATAIELPAKPVVRKILQWADDGEWGVLSVPDCMDLARWCVKVGILLSHPAAESDNPHVERESNNHRFREVAPEWLDWMTTSGQPAAGFSVYLSRRDIRGEGSFEGQRVIFVLPDVYVDGVPLRYMARSFGIRGLDITVVWHPGWEVRHPLVEAGEAVRIYPCDSPVDLSLLPIVHPGAFSFADGFAPLHWSDVVFARNASRPLSVDFDPIKAMFGETASATELDG
jgi:hypothetical protein